MGNRRTPIALAALVVGAVAGVAVWLYLGRVEQRAFRGAQLVTVLVAKRDIKQGTPADRAIDDGGIGTERVPATLRPRNAVVGLEAIRGKVTATNLLAGQILGQEFFSGARAGSTFAQQIPDGQVAISVQVEPVRGVANFVRAGDRVNILVVTPEGVKTLFENVHVLAVGGGGASAAGDGASSSTETPLVTFAVPLPAAQKIALAASNPPGSLYLTLVPPENPTVAVAPLATGSLFQGSPDPYA